jgi:hypothetical protein
MQAAVFGAHDHRGTGVAGHSDAGHGVWGTSKTSIGVYGDSEEQAGVRGTSKSNVGVAGHSETSTGVDGTSTSGTGVRGESEKEFGLYAKAPYDRKLDPTTGRIDTNAVLAAGTRAAYLDGLVEIRGDLIINGVELSQLIEGWAKWTAMMNPPYVPPPSPPPQAQYQPPPYQPPPYQPPPYTPQRPAYLAATAAAPKRARGKGKKHKKQGR